MPVDGRVSVLSGGSTPGTTQELVKITDISSSGHGKLRFDSTPSKKSIKIDPDHVVFKTSSLALLHAKAKSSATSLTSQPLDSESSDDFQYEYETIYEDGAEYDIGFIDEQDTYLAGARRILAFMYNLWRREHLCDVVIQTRNRKVMAHRVALGAYSDALANKFAEFPPGELVAIDLSDVSAETVEATLMFVYTTDIVLTDKTIADVLYCATELGFNLLIDKCLDYLATQLTSRNALKFYKIAIAQGLEDMQRTIKRFITQNFATVIESKHFVTIPFNKLVQWLTSDDFAVVNELDIFFAIVRWVDYKRRERINVASTLLRCVRFQLIGAETLVTQVESVTWLFEPRNCHEWLYDAMRYHALRASGSDLAASYAHQSRRHEFDTRSSPSADKPSPRKQKTPQHVPKSPEKASRSDGKQSSKSPAVGNPTVHYLRKDGSPTKTQNWSGNTVVSHVTKTSPNMKLRFSDTEVTSTSPRKTAGVYVADQSGTLSGDYMSQVTGLAVGGIDLQSINPDVPGRFVYMYQPQSNEWTVVTMMSEYKHHHGVADVNGKLFIIGGAVYLQSDPDRLGQAVDTVQMYDMDSSTWSQVCNMIEPRAYHSTASWRGNIYAIGGENENKTKLDSIECYNSDTNTWRFIARMVGGSKIGTAVVTYDDHLYIVGGYNKERSDSHILADVECFDLIHERWVKKKPLSVPRCHASLVVAQDRMFLVGGRSKTVDSEPRLISLSSVEVYNPDADTWDYVTDLAHARHDASCFAIGSLVYVVGGVQTPNPFCLSSVECFDAENYQKIPGIKPLPSPAAGLACTSFQA